MRILNNAEITITTDETDVFVGIPPSPGKVTFAEGVKCGQVKAAHGDDAGKKCLISAKKR